MEADLLEAVALRTGGLRHIALGVRSLAQLCLQQLQRLDFLARGTGLPLILCGHVLSCGNLELLSARHDPAGAVKRLFRCSEGAGLCRLLLHRHCAGAKARQIEVEDAGVGRDLQRALEGVLDLALDGAQTGIERAIKLGAGFGAGGLHCGAEPGSQLLDA
ncbi:hypothetical protein [Sphingobium xanthum]|uniref:hypothetical protein n=1 Tax=Sphingobium xanthum TaxID=1387165 RepID=UPI0015EC39FB|nr:hypothetical protein [Sphingobium xanthum]MCW2361612.1 hypothetical protein [Sphingobium sp. B10D3B]